VHSHNGNSIEDIEKSGKKTLLFFFLKNLGYYYLTKKMPISSIKILD